MSRGDGPAAARRAGCCAVLAALVGWSAGVRANDGITYDFYGFVMMDAIYDFDQMNPDWKDMLRPSQIPVNCPGDAGCGTDGETIFSVRQTRAGVTARIPTGLGDINTKLEFELVGVGNDAGKTTPRLRHAWGELGAFGAGQTWSTFMDIDVFPNTIEYWGPSGMIFWRNLQIRYTPYRSGGNEFAVALESPSSSIDSGKVAEIDPTLGLAGKTELPDLTAHWRTAGDWGHFQVAGILRQVGYETTTSADGEPSGEETGYGLNLSGSMKLFGRDKLMAQLAFGDAIGSYFNDGGLDLAPDASIQAETVSILGWLVFYDRYWNDEWSTSLGMSGVDIDNTGGQTGEALSESRYALVNLLHYPTNNIIVGGELQYGDVELNDGSDASDTRVQFSFKFIF